MDGEIVRNTIVGRNVLNSIWPCMMNECLFKKQKMAVSKSMLLPTCYMKVRIGYVRRNVKVECIGNDVVKKYEC